jgi:GT2 family glycosyltransferase
MKLMDQFGLIPVQVTLPTHLPLCNPSIVSVANGWAALVRVLDPIPFTSQNDPYLSSENWLIHYDDCLRPLARTRLDDSAIRLQYREAMNGLEDGRLFLWKGDLWALFSGLERTRDGFLNTMMLSRVDGDRLTDARVLPSPHGQAREKNWMPWVVQDDLYLVYSTQPLEIYRVDKQGLVRVNGTETKVVKTKTLVSGSSQVIPWGEHFLAVTHQRSRAPAASRFVQKYVMRDPDYQKKKVHFTHQLILLDSHFNIRSRSRPFKFETDGIEFCAGLATKGSRILISYGAMDERARLLELDRAEVDALLGIASSGRCMKRIAPAIETSGTLPSVDAIVLNYRNFSATSAQCLDSLASHFGSELIHVRLVDNGSPDSSPQEILEYAHKHPALKFELLPANLGFAGGMNHAAAEGESEWLMLINSDTVFLPDAMERLCRAMSSAPPDVAALGPITNAAGNEQDYPLQGCCDEVLREAADLTGHPLWRLLPVYRLDFFCVAIRRAVWQELGGLDQGYGPGYYEDFDFSIRARQAGYRLMMCEDAFVYHAGSGTFKQSKNIRSLIRKNRDLFTRRFPGVQLPHKRDGNLQTLMVYSELLRQGVSHSMLDDRIRLRAAALRTEAPKSFLKRRRWKRKCISALKGKLSAIGTEP